MDSVIPHQHLLIRRPFQINSVCDVCRKNGGGSNAGVAYHCRACDMDVCQNCINKLKLLKNSMIHPHQLMITKRRGNFSCNKCKKSYSYEDTVSMSCISCNIDICMKCYNE